MTWERRLSLTRLWLRLHALQVGLAIVALLLGAFFLLVYLPAGKPTSYEGTIDELGLHDDQQLGRQLRLWVRLDKGQRVKVSVHRDAACRKGDRITVVHLGGFRGYISGATGCRRPALPERSSPR
jgi:sulfur carrier protein ThiS